MRGTHVTCVLGKWGKNNLSGYILYKRKKDLGGQGEGLSTGGKQGVEEKLLYCSKGLRKVKEKMKPNDLNLVQKGEGGG